MTAAPRIFEVERVSVGEWCQTTLLAANLVWTTLCLGGFRPETKLVTFALTGLLLIVHLAVWAWEKRAARDCDGAGWCLLPFLAYALINVVFVTPVPWLGWLDWLGWANMGAVFWVMLNGVTSTAPRRVIFLTLVVLGVVAVVLGAYQRFVEPGWLMLGRNQVDQFLGRASGSFGIPNSLAAFLLLLLPASGALAFRAGASATVRIWWLWITTTLGLGLLLTVSRGGWIALATGLVAWPLGARGWHWRRRLLAGLLVLAVLLAAAAVIYETAPKIRERFDRLVRDSGELSRPILWRAAWEIFREHPLTGSGAGSFNAAFESHRPAGFIDQPQWVHNDYLNTAGDYGGLGLVLLLGAVGAIAVQRRKPASAAPAGGRRDVLDSRSVRAGFAVGILSFAIHLFVDFHWKLPALAMAFSVVAALALARGTRRRSAASGSVAGRAGWLLAAVVIALAMFPALRLCRAEDLRYRARQAIDAAMNRGGELSDSLLLQAERQLQRTTSLAPSHGEAWSDLAYVLQLRALADPSLIPSVAKPAVQAAERATAIARIVPEFWIRLGVALDMDGRREEAEKAFDTALRLSPRGSHAWYYYAFHLSLDTDRREAALRAIATCLSLDPGNGAAEALRVKLNERTAGALSNP